MESKSIKIETRGPHIHTYQTANPSTTKNDHMDAQPTNSSDETQRPVLEVLGNRCINRSLIKNRSSLYALCRAFVQNDGNYIRGAYKYPPNKLTSISSSRKLPPVQGTSPDGTAPDAKRTVTIVESIVGRLAGIPCDKILESHVKYLKNLNKWYRSVRNRNIYMQYKHRLDKLNSLVLDSPGDAHSMGQPTHRLGQIQKEKGSDGAEKTVRVKIEGSNANPPKSAVKTMASPATKKLNFHDSKSTKRKIIQDSGQQQQHKRIYTGT